jgi:hypothetical protein
VSSCTDIIVVCSPLSITIKPAGWLVDKSGADEKKAKYLIKTSEFIPMAEVIATHDSKVTPRNIF